MLTWHMSTTCPQSVMSPSIANASHLSCAPVRPQESLASAPIARRKVHSVRCVHAETQRFGVARAPCSPQIGARHPLVQAACQVGVQFNQRHRRLGSFEGDPDRLVILSCLASFLVLPFLL